MSWPGKPNEGMVALRPIAAIRSREAPSQKLPLRRWLIDRLRANALAGTGVS